MTPTAAPCDSPKVVILNTSPNVLPAIIFKPPLPTLLLFIYPNYNKVVAINEITFSTDCHRGDLYQIL